MPSDPLADERLIVDERDPDHVDSPFTGSQARSPKP